jgi:3-deoxy-manno-octulosonate cytidylyltransferase (CMP-KDO synthetase)
MRIIAVIPARYAATRFPAKLMQLLGERPVILHTYLNTVATGLFSDVFVVTDSELIFDTITGAGGKVIMSKQAHESGTDRIAEAVENLDADVVINVQGDEPFVKREPLEILCNRFHDPAVEVASLMHVITNAEMIHDPNCVKVVVNKDMDALYFSRSAIPYQRDEKSHVNFFKHIGIYGYRKDVLLRFTKLPPSVLEQTEKLEQLRLLENMISIRMAVTEPWSVSIDTPQDLEKAKKLLK